MTIIRLSVTLLITCAAVFAADDDWSRWRGPTYNGMARGDAPIEWSDTENVAWRVPIPGYGHSSPVLWGDRIFLTTAVPTGAAGAGQEHRFLVLSLDRNTGKTLWERVATVATPHEGYHRTYGSFASNSPITDGNYLYAFFGSRGLYCYDLDGELMWQKEFPPMTMAGTFGEGVAPMLVGDNLYLKHDHEGDSFLVALDKRTGKEIWRVERDERSSWSEPLAVTHDGRMHLIVSASSKVTSYDPATGNVLWESAGLGSNVIPAPVSADGLVFVMSGHRNPNLLAIRLGGKGDLTGTDSIVWTNNRGNSYTPSPVLHDNKLYFVSDRGLLSCFNASSGEPYYHQQRMPEPYSVKSSLVGANGKLYLSTEAGDVLVLKMGEEFEVLATNSLTGQIFVASPAIAEGSLYLRSQEALYCIRE